MADRIAVMRDGRLAQVGTPGDLYHKPVSSFVADFIGQTNLIPGEITARDPAGVRVQTKLGVITAAAAPDGAKGKVLLSIRPEQMQVSRNGQTASPNRLVGKTLESTFLGEASEHVLDVGGTRVKVIAAPPLFNVPAELPVQFDPHDVVVLPE